MTKFVQLDLVAAADIHEFLQMVIHQNPSQYDPDLMLKIEQAESHLSKALDQPYEMGAIKMTYSGGPRDGEVVTLDDKK